MTDPGQPGQPGQPGLPVLPEPLDPHRPYRVALVCLGNICRSPMADVVLRQRLGERGLGDRVEVISAGTGGWHVGGPMDERAAETLAEAGYDPSLHRARQFDATWFPDCDLVLAMDGQNHADLLAMTTAGGERDRLHMFRDFDPEQDGEGPHDVPDPYFGRENGFAEVIAIVERTGSTLVDLLEGLLARPGQEVP
jgi:protein-tyrosine phosphatase